MVVIFDKKGNPLSVHSIDAREIVKGGSHFYGNPLIESHVEDDKVEPPKKDSDIDDLNKSQLIEYAMLHYKMKLKNSWGEQRMRNEIKMSRQLEEQKNEEMEEEKEEDI